MGEKEEREANAALAPAPADSPAQEASAGEASASAAGTSPEPSPGQDGASDAAQQTSETPPAPQLPAGWKFPDGWKLPEGWKWQEGMPFPVPVLQQSAPKQEPEERKMPTAASYKETDTPILECRGLNKSYGGTLALYNINLTVRTGGVVGLLGPNGSGKSTLIKLAMGMLQPSMGEILIGGGKPSPKTKAITAYLPDTPHLPRWMRVDQAFKYVADFFPDFRMDRADELLSRLGVAPKTHLKALSKGNLEKVCLIATMARDAKLYILDEPIAGVDPAARDFILETIICNKPEGSTILLCTHLIADIEPVLSHAIFLNRGQIVLDKDVKDVYTQDRKTLDELFREVFRW